MKNFKLVTVILTSLTLSLGAFAQSDKKEDQQGSSTKNSAPNQSSYQDLNFGKEDFSAVRGAVTLSCSSLKDFKIKYSGRILSKGARPQAGEPGYTVSIVHSISDKGDFVVNTVNDNFLNSGSCLLYTSPSPRDKRQSRMPSSA